jgi:hypothetical protein
MSSSEDRNTGAADGAAPDPIEAVMQELARPRGINETATDHAQRIIDAYKRRPTARRAGCDELSLERGLLEGSRRASRATGGECLPPAEERETAFNLTPDAVPNTGVWPSVIQEEGAVNEGTFRSIDESGSGAGENPIKVNFECYAAGEKAGALLFESGPVGPETGSSTPGVLNGTSATKPSETTFEVAETGHLYALTEAELTKEETVEPTVKLTLGSPVLKDEGKTWQAAVKGAPAAGCRVKAANLFPNEIVNTVQSTTELKLENKVNPTKNFGLANTVEPVKFNCGALTTVALQGTTKGKLKFVGYLDNGTTPLVTVGRSTSP